LRSLFQHVNAKANHVLSIVGRRTTVFSHEKIRIVNVGLKRLFPALVLTATTLLSLPGRASSNTKADEEAGAVLFRDKGCAHCHGEGGVGTKKAPSLVDIRKDKAWPPEKITDQILNGGEKMPPFRESLSDEEIAQLVAYLRARNRPVPPPSATPAPPPSN
jgi:mono/diheme cytochrome c family protein